MEKTIFVSGIDTDAGKTYCTAWLANKLRAEGRSVITQKFIQTGCTGISEDILKHREIMGIEPQEVDKDGTTCPYVMTYPASPHLAAEIDHVVIDTGKRFIGLPRNWLPFMMWCYWKGLEDCMFRSAVIF